MDYPINRIRERFPSLNRELNERPLVYFDGPSGSQVVGSAIFAMVEYMEMGSANLGAPNITSRDSDQTVELARQAMADFLGGSPDEIAFGMNMTSLTFDISRALSRDWGPGDRIVVTELDHRANVDPWILAAEDRGAEVVWIPLDTNKYTLDLSDLDTIIDENTKLVAIGHASNGLGTINDVQLISNRAKQQEAIVVVDAVHSAPHTFIDREQLGADIILCSAYKFFGPHIGIASITSSLFDEMDTYKLTTVPPERPWKLETGTQSFEGLAGVTAAVDFIADLGNGPTRRDRIKSAFSLIHEHEDMLAEMIREELATMDSIHLFQSETEKTPTIAFRVKDVTPEATASYLGKRSIIAGSGHFYAKTIGDILGLNETGGWVRIGMAPYNTDSEVAYFLSVLKEFINEKQI